MPDFTLLLASNSPRRRQILALAGYSFVPAAADIDETPLSAEPPEAYVLRLAREKALRIHQTTILRQAHIVPHRPDVPTGMSLREDNILRPAHGTLPVLAADTTVADGAQILGKPVDAAEAAAMLRQLRGRAHRVYTGLALITPAGTTFDAVCATDVYMRDYAEDEITAYVASGDPLDKAGAYAIQHAGFHPVERLRGCYANVMGLPVCLLESLLREAGLTPRLGLAPCPENAETCAFCQTLAGES